MSIERHSFARITDESGDFNETCEVCLATLLLAEGLLHSFDGKQGSGTQGEVEFFYTVMQQQEAAVWQRISAAESR